MVAVGGGERKRESGMVKDRGLERRKEERVKVRERKSESESESRESEEKESEWMCLNGEVDGM